MFKQFSFVRRILIGSRSEILNRVLKSNRNISFNCQIKSAQFPKSVLLCSRNTPSLCKETILCVCHLSTNPNNDSKRKQGLTKSTEQPQSQVTVGDKVEQAGKDVSYFGVILVGITITGALIWYTFSELFGFSPNKVYSNALTKVKNNSEVIEFIGSPISGYGEETSRGRRRHVSHQEYIVDGESYMRVKFYIKGSKRKGTVHVDVKQIGRGNYKTRFLFVELSGFPTGTIIVEDNR